MTAESEPELTDFDDVANWLVAEGVHGVSPAELHGLLCGGLASGARPDPAAWLRMAADAMEIDEFTQESAKVGLLQLYQESLALLQADDLSFEPLLPDDDQLVAQRAGALGEWCQGFLSGFGQFGKQTDSSLSKEAREALGDLGQIAQIADDADESDENEADLVEVQEYVRMAALLLFTECNPAPEAKADDVTQNSSRTLH